MLLAKGPHHQDLSRGQRGEAVQDMIGPRLSKPNTTLSLAVFVESV
jgi:hypothetical protein